MNKLKYNEFVPYASDEIDVEVRIHHCKSGKDNNKLFIRRTSDGRILAFCHHCNARGVYRVGTNRGKQKLQSHKRRTGSTDNKIRIPTRAIGFDRFIDWHPLAKRWITQYLSFDEIYSLGVLYTTRLIFPIYRDTELIGYLSRKVLPDDPYPRWMAFRSQSDRDKFYWYFNKGTRECVITEDIISAKKISKFSSSYALLGSHLSEVGLIQITKNHKEFIIFMDDDKPNIKMLQLELKRRLSLFGRVKIIHVGTDPKNLNDTELEKLLR